MARWGSGSRVYWGYIRKMENKMATTLYRDHGSMYPITRYLGLGFRGPSSGYLGTRA